MTKYHVLFTKGAKVKATRTRDSCIARTRSMNEIQRIRTHRSHVCVAIYRRAGQRPALFVASSQNRWPMRISGGQTSG